MFNAAAKRILLVDHTKFEKRALYALGALSDFDVVVVDSKTKAEDISRLKSHNVHVVVADSRARHGNHEERGHSAAHGRRPE
jgi:DeoR/GlpR family transcriptional regulator of sugar metabolism